MVDNFGTPDAPSGPPAEMAAEIPEKRAGFLSTTVGKLVVGGIAIIVVLGAVAAIGIFFFLGQTSEQASNIVTAPSTETTGTASASGVEGAEPRPEPAVQDTFTFRNILEPTVKVTLAPETDSGTTDGGTVDVPADTLYLSGVSTVDGEPVAELIWNGETYTLAEGESIPGTPWQVLSIEGDTVVMLYGDSRVTLTVGQGISK